MIDIVSVKTYNIRRGIPFFGAKNFLKPNPAKPFLDQYENSFMEIQ